MPQYTLVPFLLLLMASSFSTNEGRPPRDYGQILPVQKPDDSSSNTRPGPSDQDPSSNYPNQNNYPGSGSSSKYPGSNYPNTNNQNYPNTNNQNSNYPSSTGQNTHYPTLDFGSSINNGQNVNYPSNQNRIYPPLQLDPQSQHTPNQNIYPTYDEYNDRKKNKNKNKNKYDNSGRTAKLSVNNDEIERESKHARKLERELQRELERERRRERRIERKEERDRKRQHY